MKEERKSIKSIGEGVGYSRGEAFSLRVTSAYDLEHYLESMIFKQRCTLTD